MKLKLIVFALIGSLMFASCKQTGKTGTSVLKKQKDSVAYALGISTGIQLSKFGFDSLEYDMYLKGLKDGFNKDTTFKPALNKMEANLFLDKYVRKMQNKKMEGNLAKGKEFLEKNKQTPGIKITPSGLQYIVVKEGTGATPKLDDKVKAHYAGTTIDGSEFDSSYKRGEPAIFGVNQVIAGWTEILQLMKVGAKYKVFIPSELAYGPSQQGDKIQPNSVLIFDIELISIEPKDPKDAKKKK